MIFSSSPEPFADPEPLIRRIYAYVAYRIGDGPDAEDVTSTTIERGLRYRSSFDIRKGKPESWLIGIARACIDDHLRAKSTAPGGLVDLAGSGDLETDALLRLSVAGAVAALEEGDREIIAMRYGADLSSRQIAALLGMKTNAVDVALHRARARLRVLLEAGGADQPPPSALTIGTPAPEGSR